MITRTGPLTPFDGRWALVAQHRAGSLEAAVAAVRKRNLILSSGILLLLTMAVGLIIVSSRRAQELARQQMEFVAAVSHELRTPVSVIGAAAGNLADGVVGDPQRVRKYGETIQGEARRLAETVERVLQLAGIAAGRAAAAPVPIDPAELVNDSIGATAGSRSRRPGSRSKAIVADDLPYRAGRCDGAALGAAEPDQQRGEVRRRCALDPRDGAAVAEPPVTRPTACVFTVEDRGLGIDRRRSQAHLRAVLSRPRSGLAADQGQRPRPEPRAAHRRGARRPRHRDERARQGQRVHALAAGACTIAPMTETERSLASAHL